ncbi:hypothetical protein [Lentzea flaviverrucosa]|uniref:Small secreted domain n=1 Tax=Lentzea flaviverrucosa TaxID=200379 RepID=A0A1H9MI61_9PSEU|nr:hypothetical protein [Lentzea flaviverrucosa]RDI30910.1 hypothetical protein DFR72_104243 [Lentzea flaviverrucosa]SER23348.1 hypothetical protein SAMN05216195_104384 [Lentzea flaviverrucosa]
MLKKACVATVAAAGLMMFGATGMASAAPDFHQTNGSVLSVLNGNNVNAVVGACGNNVGVLGAAVPINSPSLTETCAAGGVVDGDDVNVEG